MTGFGRAEQVVDGYDIVVEVRSVNHRFFDFSARVPRGYGFLEEKLRPYLQAKVSRGKLDVSVELDSAGDPGTQVQVNMPLAREYFNAMRAVQRELHLPDDITTGTLLRFPDIFTVRRRPEDEEKICARVKQVLDAAFESLLAMRKAEGKKMEDDILSRAASIRKTVAQIEERSPRTVEEYREKLKGRISDLLGGAAVDEQRVLTEAAVYADKVSVAEETVRLRSHISQFTALVGSREAVGRRLDFLVQEMNREANTIGSKCVDAQIAHWVVDMKAEIEKIREQIQNIE